MRISDWSSDVCSSDLLAALSFPDGKGGFLGPQLVVDDGGDVTLLIHKGYELEQGDSSWVESPDASHEEQVIKNLLKRVATERPGLWTNVVQMGRGACRESRWQNVLISVGAVP